MGPAKEEIYFSSRYIPQHEGFFDQRGACWEEEKVFTGEIGTTTSLTNKFKVRCEVGTQSQRKKVVGGRGGESFFLSNRNTCTVGVDWIEV